MKRRRVQHDQSIEIAATEYRDCILFGDPDRSDQLLNEIRPHCERLMNSYGIQWDSVLEQFMHATLLAFSRFDGESFLSFFLHQALRNFNIPDRPLNVDSADYQGTGLCSFQRTWTSQPERKIMEKMDSGREKS